MRREQTSPSPRRRVSSLAEAVPGALWRVPVIGALQIHLDVARSALVGLDHSGW